ncbi:MAG: cysteine hydrolase [Actinobacteria bacterium]|nr:cysteine hydrolase [Actinomycetota bacterium]
MDKRYENLETPYTRLNPESCALLTVDVQNDWGDPGGARPMPDLDRVIPNILEVVDSFRRAGRPIVHVVRIYLEDASNVDYCRRWQFERGEARAVVAGSWGSQLVASLNPTGEELDVPALLDGRMQELTHTEFVMYKPRFGAFHGTPLKDFLEEKGIDSVVIVGITFPNCVLATQLGATDNDFRVGLVPGACTQVDEAGLRAMQNKGVQLMSVGELKDFLGIA